MAHGHYLSLRSRVAVAFALFGVGVSLLMAADLYLAARQFGRQLVEQTLKAELEDYQSRKHRNPLSLPPSTATLLGFVDPAPDGAPAFPPQWHPLPPGYHDLEYSNAPYRAMVAIQDNMRYVMLFDLTRLRQREASYLVFLGAGVLVMTMLSAVGGMWLASRVIEPVSALVRRVKGLGPHAPFPVLAQGLPPDEVGELAAAFDGYLQRLREFIEREQAFTADVSHELRTPLAVIRGAVELLREGAGFAEGRDRERLERVERAAQDMTGLTEALLLLSRELDPRQPMPDSCSVAEVLNDVVDKHRHLLRNKSTQVELEMGAEPRLQTKAALLFVVLGNLVRNALAHTPEGWVRIRLETDRVVIRDTGIGMPEEVLRQLFHGRFQGPERRGEGIGLALVKRICDRHGWRIDLNSREGEGTEVTLFFEPRPLKSVKE
ncbi:MAG: HAMP domain-containing histidine kinase [Magnetococcales bacterium]|nr:HAMP domain-containing histidine kinase [Magnetococcales bacterium]